MRFPHAPARTAGLGLLLALGASGCFQAAQAPERPGPDPGPTHGIWASDAIRPEQCRTHKGPKNLLVGCMEMISRADPLDRGGTGQRSRRPELVLTPEGRLRYTDTVRQLRTMMDDTRDGLEVAFVADGWDKISTGKDDVLHFRLRRSYGTLDLVITLKQIGGTATYAERLVEFHAVMETLEPVI